MSLESGVNLAAEQELTGMRAMVTGSSSGIGRAIALELARAGCDVLVHARANRQAANQVLHEVRAHGRRSELLLSDLSDPVQQQSLVTRAWETWSGLEIWINNAGADVLTGERSQWSFEEKLERLWQVDVLATVRLSRLAGELMSRSPADVGRRCIVNVGWDQAETGMAGDSGQLFATVKAAVMAFSRSLAMTLAPQVRVNCVAPGWIKTAWGDQAPSYWQERAVRESLSGRWGTPEDVAHTVRFLVSPATQFVNGQVIHVNGGFRSSNA
jgi:3-oxoacyl-[acyl-carrier protein] reductase